MADENSESQSPAFAEIQRLIHEADSLAKANQLDTAIVLGNLALEGARKEFGDSDTTVASAMSVLGKCYFDQAQYAPCESLWSKALAIREEKLSPDDPQIVLSLNDLGLVYRRQGKYREAEPLYKRALAIREKTLGPEHLDVASSLHVLAVVYRNQDRYTEAEPLCRRSLAIREKALGPDHPDVASVIQELSIIYSEMGKLGEAEQLCKRAIAIREKVLGSEHPDLAMSLMELATIYKSQRKYREAEPLFKRALEIREKALGPDHPAVALSLNNMVILLVDQGRFREAEPLFKRALAIREKALGPEHPDVAMSLNNLAALYLEQAKYGEIEPLLRRAIAIWEKVLGPEHPQVTLSLTNLAILYMEQGRYSEAERLLKRGLEIREKALGPASPAVANSLNNLASLYEKQGKYTEAEPLCKQGLDIREKALGPEHPDVALSLANLADLYVSQHKYSEAEPLHLRALGIWEKDLGPGNPEVARSLDDIANLYAEQERYGEAEPLYKRAHAIIEKVLGSEHRDMAENLMHLARVNCSMGEFDEALENYQKLQTSREYFIEYVFSYASEEQKVRYLEKYPLIDQSLLSFALLHPSTESKRAALDMILRGKAAVIHAVAAEKEIAYCSYDEEIRQTAERHSEICGEIAALVLAGTEYLDPEIYRARSETLYSTKDSLETELSTFCSEFKEEMASRRFRIDDIVEALPEGTVLWEFLRYEPYDFKKAGSEKERTGPPRYLAITLDHTGTINLTDLGDAGEIDSLVSLARTKIYKARGEVFSPLVTESERSLAHVTGEIYERIFVPLEKSIGAANYIFISPDGELNLMPFEILPCPDGEFVVERFRVSYLSSGRDLLSFKKRHEPSDWALLMADPDFELSGEALARHREKTVTQPEVLSMLFEPSRGASECLESQFDPLPYSQKEIESVGRTLRKKDDLRVRFYDGGDALEEIVKGMETPPRVFHLATHGYFCGDVGEGEDMAGVKMLENPLLRSGLALAGANRSRERGTEETSKGEDGILTAFEVSGLNLVGTELATLSACETGVGEVRNGEGVYGLRRSFQHAGAEAILMSLWKMPDREIYGLMDSFYRNWSEGETKQEALRQSVLKMIRDLREKYGTAHPLLWGGFVLAGNPN
jgi:tetratricopeptide (TPR) repeat protein/CHAT domain-containing protein